MHHPTTTQIYTLSLHDALPISNAALSSNIRFRWEYQPGSDLFFVYSDGRDTLGAGFPRLQNRRIRRPGCRARRSTRSEEHTSELQSPYDLVCRLLLEKKKKKQ